MDYRAVTRNQWKNLYLKASSRRSESTTQGTQFTEGSTSRKGLSDEGWSCQNLPSSDDYQLWSISDE